MSRYDDDKAGLTRLSILDYIHTDGPVQEFLDAVFDALMKYQSAMDAYQKKAQAEKELRDQEAARQRKDSEE